MTRSSKNWKSMPGGFDELNLVKRKYKSDNKYEFPEIRGVDFLVDEGRRMLSYKHRDATGKMIEQAICTFWLDDYRFLGAWNYPERALTRVSRFWATLTPDFSLFTDWPVAVQIWNTYRTRWCGRYWQDNGIIVIPTVNWSLEHSFEWCFDGLPRNSVVSISVPDCRRRVVLKRFAAGFDKMIEVLAPSQILVYGKLPFSSDISLEFKQDWKYLDELIN